MKTTMRVLTTSLTEVEVASSESPPEPPADEASRPVKPRPKLTPLLYLAAGAMAALSITFFRCDQREMNTYVHAESGSVVQVLNGEPTPGPRGR